MMNRPIHEGESIFRTLAWKDYYDPVLARMFLHEYKPWWYIFSDNCEVDESNYPKRKEFGTIVSLYLEQHNLRGIGSNQWYIVSVYNVHHQQQYNPQLMAVHFDCLKKEIIYPWRYDQCYPGYPYHLDPDEDAYKNGKRVYDDNGAPFYKEIKP